MIKTPFMMMWWGDYFTSTAHLTTEESGAYLALIGHMWLSGGWLANNDKQLARITNTGRRWSRVRQSLNPLLLVSDDGSMISQKRLLLELQKALVIHEKRSHSGRKGGITKSANLLKSNGATLANATAPLKRSSTSHSHSHSHSHKESNIEFIEFWKSYPRRQAKRTAEKAFASARKRASFSEIMDGVKIYAKERRAANQPEFTALGATWLNGDRWADERRKTGYTLVDRPQHLYKEEIVPEELTTEERVRRVAVLKQVKRSLNKGEAHGLVRGNDEMPKGRPSKD